MIYFWIKEAFRIFGRAKTSFILSLISLTVSILLVTASFYSIFLSNQLENRIKEKFILNIFLDDSLSQNSIEKIRVELMQRKYTSNLNFIDKDKAAEIFITDTGEDFRKILDYNPLPASFSLKLKSEFVDTDSVKIIKSEISSINGIDDVVFEHEVLDSFISKLKEFQKYIFLLTAVLILISIYITYSTIKLIISLKHEELETMKLVGAKLSTIKIPIILNEVLTGLLAGVLSYIFIKLILFVLSKYGVISSIQEPPAKYLILVLLIGPVLSYLVSVLVLRKITLKI